MKDLFYPRSIVVMGVSPKPTNLGLLTMRNLKAFGYQGPLYAVGQHGGRVRDQEILTSMTDVPRPIDLAIILVPAVAVLETLEQCGQAGVKWAVVMTSGFAELSEEGRGVQQSMVALCERYGVRLVGPNCVGVLNTENRLAATFIPLPIEHLREGPVGILAQSGSVAVELADLLSRHKVGVSKYVSLGNKLATNEADVLSYLIEEDSRTTQVTMYLESIVDGRGFFRQAQRSTKPIVLYKANIVPGGTKAALSHTAALANDDAIVEAMCRQANIVRAHNFDELLTFSKIMSLPPMRGNRVGIAVFSGGAGVVSADYCYRHGLEVPELPGSISADIDARARVKAIRRGNPLDLGDTLDGGLMVHAVEAMLRSPEIDGVALCLALDPAFDTPGTGMEEIIRRVAVLSLEAQKPVAISFSPILASVDAMRAAVDFPIFSRPESAVEALAASRDYWRRRSVQDDALPVLGADRVRARRIIKEALATGGGDLGEAALDLLKAYAIEVEPLHPAASAEEAAAQARAVGYPVALKVRSPQISHKSDVGGVAVGLEDDDAVVEAFTRITSTARERRPDADILGVTVQKMINAGKEVIIGAKRDEQFGPVAMFGFGGVMVELFKDVSFRLAPLTERDAREMIDEVRASQLLGGFRGEEPFDRDAVVDALLRLSRLVADFPEIVEVDVNPLKVLLAGEGCRAIDARVFLEEPNVAGDAARRAQAAISGAKTTPTR